MIYVPASIVQRARDHPVAGAVEPPRQIDDVVGKLFIIQQAARHLAFRITISPECEADPALRHINGLSRMDNALIAA